MKKNKINPQTVFRKKVFTFHQYWNMTYTEKNKNGDEQDFSVFIKAKSYDLAKKILCEKVKEDNPDCSAKSIQGFMFHKDYKSPNTGRMTFKKWEQIRTASFPNLNNILYKYHRPRAEGKWNRWHFPSNHLAKYQFKKGAKSPTANKFKKSTVKNGKIIILDEWSDFDSFDFSDVKNEIINAFKIHNNVRKKSARHLGIGPSTLHKWMNRIPDIDWDKDYPAPKQIPPRVSKEERSIVQKRVMEERKLNGIPVFPKRLETEAKRLKALKATQAKKADAYRRSLVPKIKEALSASNNVRYKAAEYLNIKFYTFKSWLNKTKYIVDWTKEYPTTPWNKIQHEDKIK